MRARCKAWPPPASLKLSNDIPQRTRHGWNASRYRFNAGGWHRVGNRLASSACDVLDHHVDCRQRSIIPGFLAAWPSAFEQPLNKRGRLAQPTGLRQTCCLDHALRQRFAHGDAPSFEYCSSVSAGRAYAVACDPLLSYYHPLTICMDGIWMMNPTDLRGVPKRLLMTISDRWPDASRRHRSAMRPKRILQTPALRRLLFSSGMGLRSGGFWRALSEVFLLPNSPSKPTMKQRREP